MCAVSPHQSVFVTFLLQCVDCASTEYLKNTNIKRYLNCISNNNYY